MFQRLALAAILAATLPLSAAHAQRPAPPQGPLVDGYLCCNMRTYGKQISDINYDEQGMSILAVGTRARITGYDFRWVDLDVGGRPQRLKNDYSRNMSTVSFGQRYVVTEDPKLKLAALPEKTRAAIEAMKVIPGMTREQVLMALGYPVGSENPSLDAPVWRYWLDTWAEYQVVFEPGGTVKTVVADPVTLNRVSLP